MPWPESGAESEARHGKNGKDGNVKELSVKLHKYYGSVEAQRSTE